MTKNGGARLPRLLSQLGTFADEIIVGVDDSSVDNTLDIAQKWADVVYRFALSGHTAPARELVFKYATGDWILSIDDDELLEEGFGEVVRDLTSCRTITHAWFPRKAIISLEPCLFAYSPAWYPDWQRRLFRNDRTLVHKPSKVHTGYWVSGHGQFETRASILHLEQVLFDAAARAKKDEQYEALGFKPAANPEPGAVSPGPTTRAANLPTIRITDPLGRSRVKKRIHRLPRAPNPKWAARILSIDTVSHARPGDLVNATVHVQNSGSLAWMPHSVAPPFVSLGTHLWDDQGNQLVRGRDRFAVREPVKPGGKAVFLVEYRAPETPGTYSFEWDMFSQGQFWFGRRTPRASRTSKKSKTLRSTLVVGDHSLANPPSTNGNR